GYGWVKKLNTTGAIISTTAVGVEPIEMAYDGEHMWVTDYVSSDVMIVGGHGGVVKKIQLAPSANPEGILFDGKYIWVANNGVGANSVSKFNAATMTLIGTYSVGVSPDGVAFDGIYVWVTNSYDNTVVKLDRETGQILRTYPTGPFPLSAIFDGKNVWIGSGAPVTSGISAPDAGTVVKLRAAGGV